MMEELANQNCLTCTNVSGIDLNIKIILKCQYYKFVVIVNNQLIHHAKHSQNYPRKAQNYLSQPQKEINRTHHLDCSWLSRKEETQTQSSYITDDVLLQNIF